MSPDDIRHSRVYRSGRGLRPRPVRIRALDPDRARTRRTGCAILAIALAVGACCGSGLFAMAVLVLDW